VGGENAVRKYAPSGALIWERRPSNRGARITNVAVAPSGNVVAASDNGLIVKYDARGTQLFRSTRNFRYSGAVNVALGPNEEIAATYTDSGMEGTVLSAGLRVFAPDGTERWGDSVYTFGSSASPAVTFTADGHLYWTTEHWACGGSFTFDYEVWDLTCSGDDDSDPSRSAILVRKYRPDGAVVWSRVFNKHRHGTDASAAIAAASASELYVVGATESPVNGVRAGGVDAFVLRLDSQGKRVWSR
jgi:hypothetical protein